MKVIIISAGRYPVPAIKGGAVSNLIEHLISGNSNKKEVDLTITSPYDRSAEKKSKIYKNCSFLFIKIPSILSKIENIIYSIIKKFFPRKDFISIKSICSFPWFIIENAIFLKKNEFDYVIIENTARLFWCIKLFGNRKKYRGKVYYHLHNEPKKLGGCMNIIKECKEIICVSEYIKKVITSQSNILYIDDEERVKVLYNCIDTKRFAPLDENIILETKKKFGIKNSDYVILFSGRIDKEKGILEVLESLKYVKTKNIKLLIVGSSFYGMDVKTDFEEKIINMSKEFIDKVIFTGFLKYEEMPLIYNICDIAVLPSMWEEPAGLTIVEAMSCERAVITTLSGGIPEYADSNSAIILKRDEDISKNIADKIDYLLNNPKVMVSMAKNGRMHVLKNFDSQLYMNRMVKILKENR